MRHTVVKPRYTNMKNQSEISWQFPVHPRPRRLRNYNEQTNIISFQIAQALHSAIVTWQLPIMAETTVVDMKPRKLLCISDTVFVQVWEHVSGCQYAVKPLLRQMLQKLQGLDDASILIMILKHSMCVLTRYRGNNNHIPFKVYLST